MTSAPNRRDTHAAAALLKSALAGDDDAMRRLVRRLRPILVARIRRAGAEPVEDVVQALWLTLLERDGRRLRAFDPTRGITLEGFVGMLADREVSKHRRRGQALKRGHGMHREALDDAPPIEAERASPESAVVGARLAQDLIAHLESELSSKGLIFLRFLYCDGCSVAETAAALGVTTQVVYNWQHKIRGLARAWLARAGDVG